MKDDWYIYKGSGRLGPFTAEAVRQGLREGTIDPFDMVGRDGSSLRREIVEVDELFHTHEIAHEKHDATSARQPQNRGIKASSFGDVEFQDRSQDFSRIAQSNQRPGNAGVAAIGDGPLHLAADPQTTVRMVDSKPPPRDQSPRRQRTPKHYYVTDAGERMLGPLSLEEIRSLFYRGVLPQDARVMREGSSAQVPVNKFLAVFSNGQKHPLKSGAHPRLRRSLTALPNTSTTKAPISPLAILTMAIGLLLLGAAGRLVWESRHPMKSLSQLISTTSKSAPMRRASKSQMRHPKTPTLDDTLKGINRPDTSPYSSDTQEDAPATGPTQPLPIPAPPVFKDELDTSDQATQPTFRSPNRRSNESRANTDRPSHKSERISRPKLARSRSASVPIEIARPPQRKPNNNTNSRLRLTAIPATPPPTVPRAAPAPAAAAIPQAKANSSSRSISSLVDGTQVRNLGPLSFDRNALSQCQAACTITFSGSDGSVRGVFFKKIWGPALERSSGSVYLSGSVRKADGGTKIILSGVQ